MITNLLPVEATHTSLDLWERPPLLVPFSHPLEQKIGPSFSPNGVNLEFEVIGDRNNFIDLRKIYLEIECRIKQQDGNNLRFDGGDPALSDDAIFVNNVLHSLFADCTITANGIKISNANGLYAHKSFLETEYSHTKDAKDTWLNCQGYFYETNPGAFRTGSVLSRKQMVRSSASLHIIGKVASDIFTCAEHLISGVNLRISFLRSANDFVTIAEDDAKHYRAEIVRANLYVKKMAITDKMVSVIEKTLLKSPAIYKYTEVIPKTFLIATGQRSWKHEDIFTKEPIRRMMIAMNTNAAFVGSNNTNPFHYQKFDLSEVVVYRNGIPIVGTPLPTVDNKHVYFTTLNALAFGDNSHGIKLSEYDNHFVMCFDLTSTEEASHDYVHPELTNASLTVELKFNTALRENVEILFLGEKHSIIYIDSARNVSKNVLMTPTNG